MEEAYETLGDLQGWQLKPERGMSGIVVVDILSRSAHNRRNVGERWSLG